MAFFSQKFLILSRVKYFGGNSAGRDGNFRPFGILATGKRSRLRSVVTGHFFDVFHGIFAVTFHELECMCLIWHGHMWENMVSVYHFRVPIHHSTVGRHI